MAVDLQQRRPNMYSGGIIPAMKLKMAAYALQVYSFKNEAITITVSLQFQTSDGWLLLLVMWCICAAIKDIIPPGTICCNTDQRP
jgi:hypothetical protein